MKTFLSIIFSWPFIIFSQISHTVAPKESLYSLGREYKISPKEIAAYNNLSMETGLVIGQVIKIPVSNSGVAPIQKTSGVSAPVSTPPSSPVYHRVQKKETLYSISRMHPNTSVDDIKKWNHLQSDALTEGINLIVGYMEASASKAATLPDSPGTASTQPVKTPEQPVATVSQAVITDVNPVTSSKPVTTPKAMTANATKPGETAAGNRITGKDFNGGFFKAMFEQQTKDRKLREETGTAATFKSSSGWEDGKYYCLHNNAPAGSIVKITNSSTQKIIYAKVLDVIPDLSQNRGISLRLSNAAASELGAGENTFESIVTY